MNESHDDVFKPSGFSETIFRERYAFTPEETWEEACNRVANQMAKAEVPEKQKHYEKKFQDILQKNYFVPGGRIWYNSGRNNPQLLNCFVLSNELDSKEGWGNIAKEMIVTSMTGGGCGIDFTDVRPKGSPIFGQKGECPGPVSLMELIDNCAEPVKSGGQRRVALMFSLDLQHPDIEDFLDAKLKKGKLSHANISVRCNNTKDFIKAVKTDGEIELSWKGKFKKTISAKKLWEKIVKNAYNSAEPGFLNWELVASENNISYSTDLVTTNPCVTGDTRILTDKGYVPIIETVGKDIFVWNGLEMAPVKPYSTGFRNIVRVTFSDGTELKCTENHEFVIQEGWEREGKQTKIKAEDLEIGMKLAKFAMPFVVHGEEYHFDGYSQGFYSGDGSENYMSSFVYEPKYPCMKRLRGKFGKGNDKRVSWKHGPMYEKNFVPINGTSEYCLDWLAGILDSDGYLTKDENGQGFQITSIDKQFLKDIRLMLSRLGVRAKVVKGHSERIKEIKGHEYSCKETHRLLINNWDAAFLVEMGLKCERLEHHGNYPQRDARQFVKVVEIEEEAPEETFCFTEPKTNLGTFEGIVTGQCGEIALEKYGNCCLGHIVLLRFIDVNGEVNWNLLGNTIRTSVRFLDNVLSVNSFPLPEMKDNANKHRRIGLGTTGLADMLVILGYKYGSEEGNKFIDKLYRFISKSAYEASVMLAVEKGAFPACDPQKHIESGFMKRMTSKIRALVQEHGIRNCALLTIAPTGTVSILSDNCSAGIEPMFAPAYERRFWKGDKREVELVFHPLFSKFLEEGKSVKNFIGSHDLDVKNHMEVQKIIQKHIDNAVSKTINMAEDYSMEEMSDIWLEYLPYLKGTTFYRENTRGYVDDNGVTHEPPLVALTLKEAKEKYDEKHGIDIKSEVILNDCPTGVCSL